jgi:hypothetical protein
MADDKLPHHYAEHLEFLGYTCNWQPDGWLYASHAVRWNFFLRPTELGVRFHCTIHLGFLTERRRISSLEFLNRVNQQAFLVRFTLDYEPTTETFLARARMVAPAEYRRQEFGAWMDRWQGDLELLRDAPWADEEEEAEEADDTRADSAVN